MAAAAAAAVLQRNAPQRADYGRLGQDDFGPTETRHVQRLEASPRGPGSTEGKPAAWSLSTFCCLLLTFVLCSAATMFLTAAFLMHSITNYQCDPSAPPSPFGEDLFPLTFTLNGVPTGAFGRGRRVDVFAGINATDRAKMKQIGYFCEVYPSMWSMFQFSYTLGYVELAPGGEFLRFLVRQPWRFLQTAPYQMEYCTAQIGPRYEIQQASLWEGAMHNIWKLSPGGSRTLAATTAHVTSSIEEAGSPLSHLGATSPWKLVIKDSKSLENTRAAVLAEACEWFDHNMLMEYGSSNWAVARNSSMMPSLRELSSVDAADTADVLSAAQSSWQEANPTSIVNHSVVDSPSAMLSQDAAQRTMPSAAVAVQPPEVVMASESTTVLDGLSGTTVASIPDLMTTTTGMVAGDGTPFDETSTGYQSTLGTTVAVATSRTAPLELSPSLTTTAGTSFFPSTSAATRSSGALGASATVTTLTSGPVITASPVSTDALLAPGQVRTNASDDSITGATSTDNNATNASQSGSISSSTTSAFANSTTTAINAMIGSDSLPGSVVALVVAIYDMTEGSDRRRRTHPAPKALHGSDDTKSRHESFHVTGRRRWLQHLQNS
eukprot:TRINITY_DN18713_c0_g1_i1.p1 TRINITY_DN18713_c0_g1~~TRINITY_DN18713_c0_g1_i1.p1  ORF type:complete len:607 (-),score=82.04 TRINITY_DN18713_c0_g1_i1:280-2100(-)